MATAIVLVMAGPMRLKPYSSLALAAWFSACVAWCAGADTFLIEWTYDRNGDFEGWLPNSHLTDVKVENGALQCRGEGADPILELGPIMDVPASAWQFVEVRMKADRQGTAELFWSNTTQSRYGGFSQEKSTRFSVFGDGQWHAYRVFPFWHKEKKIIRLRLDPYAGAGFSVDYVRIGELPARPEAGSPEFDFAGSDGGWVGVGGANLARGPAGCMATATNSTGFLLGPPVQVQAQASPWVSVRMASSGGRYATLLFATDQAYGLQSHSFPLKADQAEHTYNLDLHSSAKWRGRIIAVGLRPWDGSMGQREDRALSRATVRWLKVASEPQGDAELEVVALGMSDALPRAGAPSTMTGIVRNRGGKSARNLRVRLTLPRGVEFPGAEAAARSMDLLTAGQETVFTWTVGASEPVQGEATLLAAAENAAEVGKQTRVLFTQRLSVRGSPHVPEPKPVRGKHRVGVYYFPGWKTAEQWLPIRRFPERRPVLGWYQEGSPEIADWHIKWAVEHGITYFVYDWYWCRGARQLEHALHDGYLKSRYRRLLQFCLLWANHNPPGTSSLDDSVKVTRYWIENYFRLPEYLLVDGKPVVVIFSPDRLSEDLGGANVKAVLETMRAECCAAGLKGLYLVACAAGAGDARRMATDGYDALTAYTWPGLGLQEGERFGPFETLLEGYLSMWGDITRDSPIPLLAPICGGWDSRPWHGEANLVRYERTPELFRKHLQQARDFLESHGAGKKVLDLVLVEAWNEWGEGSYIEPHQEHGFGYLDAIREVFTNAPREHDDLTPMDAGLGPYDVPALSSGRD